MAAFQYAAASSWASLREVELSRVTATRRPSSRPGLSWENRITLRTCSRAATPSSGSMSSNDASSRNQSATAMSPASMVPFPAATPRSRGAIETVSNGGSSPQPA